jgi:hypothetical protein
MSSRHTGAVEERHGAASRGSASVTKSRCLGTDWFSDQSGEEFRPSGLAPVTE